MNTLLQILLGVLIFYIIITYLLPLLSGIILTIVTIFVVCMAIAWLLRFAGIDVINK